jgi:hypothetical protein
VRKVILGLGVAIATGCGGSGMGAPTPVGPDEGPVLAVQRFMQAVADSDLARMAELWGTQSGPASQTGRPANYQRRIAVIHAYLVGNTATVAGEIEQRGAVRVLAVDLTREGCRRRVPFTVVRTAGGQWLVNNIELGLVGVPGRPCPGDHTIPRNPPSANQRFTP